MPLRELIAAGKRMLSGRKPMSATRKKLKRAKKMYQQKGPAGEQRGYRVSEKSPVGKIQARNRRTKQMLDELD